MIDYNNRKFRVMSNSENGETDGNTIFLYQQTGDILSCNYKGEQIINGHLLAKVRSDGSLEMAYHQINTKGELLTGNCLSTPEILPDGRVRLHEKWQWTSGDFSKGESTLEEIKE
ncbi:n-acetylglutamate synthase [Arcticibacterium luteifluviistationis]|uniref:N-acetylglutamate synthase n=1 Tax=Arcticibacterium luteifluviistationis TaxID=1784714 RepID=A0A2Z4GDW0_9BACT|nr:n-acetylglutamate synthase [Arcticibacterium luteifluviistationis]AWV99330.1 n-acetylglutamate synthase [Arcticibacterium luteifluviistationis]